MGAHAHTNGNVPAVDNWRVHKKRPFLERVRYFLWDPETGEVLGRTPKRWGILGLIYLGIYTGTVILFSICMCGLLYTLPEGHPRYLLADSLIGDNPGMSHRPLFYEEAGLIYYTVGNETHAQRYANQLDSFLQPYKDACDKGKCAFDPTQLGKCGIGSGFGYVNGTPCIIIKLNRVWAWKPVFYDGVPPDAPEQLVDQITESIAKVGNQVVYVWCIGEGGTDREALSKTKTYYYPGPYLHGDFFPYEGQEGYLSPLVAVQFENFPREQLVTLRCTAWAQNLRHSNSTVDRLAGTKVEMMLASPPVKSVNITNSV